MGGSVFISALRANGEAGLPMYGRDMLKGKK
jgi:hypothetical protein